MALGILMVLGFQRIGVGSALAYILPGAVVWIGFLMTGAHPTLAGVVLGLMTPVRPVPMREHPLDVLSRVAEELRSHDAISTKDTHRLERPLRQFALARREMLPPVVRVQISTASLGRLRHHAALRPGECRRQLSAVSISSAGGAQFVMLGVGLALVAGKPLGVDRRDLACVRLGWCRLPPGVTWGGVCLVGLLAGIGFTMSIFIAMLAFTDDATECSEARRAVGLARCCNTWSWVGCRIRSTPAQTLCRSV